MQDYLGLPEQYREKIQHEISIRKKLDKTQRNAYPVPVLAQESRISAAWWAIECFRQDRPFLFWFGLIAAVSRVGFYLYVGMSGLI